MAEKIEIGPIVGVLDLETLGTFDDSIILSGGIVVADITKRIPFEKLITEEYSWFFKFNAVEQKQMGRALDPNCVNRFWKNDEKVKEAARVQSFYPDQSRDFSVHQFHDRLITELTRLKGHDIHWFDRNGFDFVKLAHLYDRTLGRGDLTENQLPFKPHNTWEISTVLQHLGQDRYAGIGPWHYETRGFIYHDPVHDSALDWLRYQHALESVGLIEVTDI